MTRYRLSFPHRHRQFIHFDAEFQAAGDTLHLQLPAWRPGRYELGNFAKSIRGFEVTDSTGHPLAYQKATKDLWVVDTQGSDTVKLKYQFYANTLNAGSTWLDDEQVYVNPVNCFFYDANHQDAPFEVALDLPASTPIACQLRHEKRRVVCRQYPGTDGRPVHRLRQAPAPHVRCGQRNLPHLDHGRGAL